MDNNKSLLFPEESVNDLLRRLNDLALINIKSRAIPNKIKHTFASVRKAHRYRMEPYPCLSEPPMKQTEQNETTILCVCNLNPDTTLQDIGAVFEDLEVTMTLNVWGLLVAKVHCRTKQAAIDIALKQNGIVLRGRPMRIYVPCKPNPGSMLELDRDALQNISSPKAKPRKRGGIPLMRFKAFREEKQHETTITNHSTEW